MKKSRLAIITLLLAIAGGCGDGDLLSDVGNDAGLDGITKDGGEDTIPIDDLVDDSSADTRGDTGGHPDDVYVSWDINECESFTLIDFPCNTRFECTSLTEYREMRTYWCDIPCCGGGSCDYLGMRECPAGTVCYDGYYADEGTEIDPCRGDECNVSEGRPCPKGQFCETAPGDCGGSGVCRPIYDDDEPESYDGFEMGGPLVTWSQICGCDDITYSGRWDRLEAGASPSHEGYCCNLEKMDLTLENLAGHGVFVMCANWYSSSPPESMPSYMRGIVLRAEYGSTGMLTGCRGGEAAYIGNLILTESGGINPDQFDALCSLASIYEVKSIKGQPKNYCETLPCYSDVLCGRDCPSACGCCACPAGETRCPNGSATQTCTAEGCWDIQVPCPSYTRCVDDDQGVSCRPVN